MFYTFLNFPRNIKKKKKERIDSNRKEILWPGERVEKEEEAEEEKKKKGRKEEIREERKRKRLVLVKYTLRAVVKVRPRCAFNFGFPRAENIRATFRAGIASRLTGIPQGTGVSYLIIVA